jgi:sodium pump decarboxylase gamma subunit
MKKYLLVLGMLTCILGLTACGSDETKEEGFVAEQDALDYGDQVVEDVAAMYAQGSDAVESYIAQNENLESVFSSWESALDDLGDYNAILGHAVKFDGDQAIITVTINGTKTDPKGELREAEVEIIVDKDEGFQSFTVNVDYTTGEKMTKAALNTLLGMGTVFVILVLIMLIISMFSWIPKIQAKLSNKNKAGVKERAVDNTIAQIIENEELSDDTELVAVIAAAIAASEGAASTDGFVVRSIKRANTNKWQRA